MKELIWKKYMIACILILSMAALCITGCKNGTAGEDAPGTQTPTLTQTATVVPTEGYTSTPANDDFSNLFPDNPTTASTEPPATNDPTQTPAPATATSSTASADPTPTKTPVRTPAVATGGLTSATDNGNQNWGPLS